MPFFTLTENDKQLLKSVTIPGWKLIELTTVEEKANSKKDGTNIVFAFTLLEGDEKGITHAHFVSTKNPTMSKRNLVEIGAAFGGVDSDVFLDSATSEGGHDFSSDVGKVAMANFGLQDNGRGKQVMQALEFRPQGKMIL